MIRTLVTRPPTEKPTGLRRWVSLRIYFSRGALSAVRDWGERSGRGLRNSLPPRIGQSVSSEACPRTWIRGVDTGSRQENASKRQSRASNGALQNLAQPGQLGDML